MFHIRQPIKNVLCHRHSVMTLERNACCCKPENCSNICMVMVSMYLLNFYRSLLMIDYIYTVSKWTYSIFNCLQKLCSYS